MGFVKTIFDEEKKRSIKSICSETGRVDHFTSSGKSFRGLVLRFMIHNHATTGKPLRPNQRYMHVPRLIRSNKDHVIAGILSRYCSFAAVRARPYKLEKRAIINSEKWEQQISIACDAGTTLWLKCVWKTPFAWL